MTKISKFLLFIFCLICLFCYIGSVNAETIDYDYYNSFSTNSRTITFNNVAPGTQQRFDYLLNTNNLDLRNYDKIMGMVYINNITQSKFYSNALNISLDCTDTRTISNGGTLYTITYPDRTQSTVSGTEYDYYCEHYDQDTSLNIINYQYNFDNKPNVLMSLIDTNDQWHTCVVDNMGNYTCPGKSLIKQIVIIIYTNGVTSNYNLYLLNSISKIKSDTQEIINNQNQNTTTINNNINNLNDNITSDNITGNNSNDSISTISNSFSSSNDFILNLFTLPYNFITTIMNGVTDSCTPISLGTIFDYELVMPCINLNNWLGNVWTSIVDVVLAGMLSFAFRKRIHDFFFAIIRLDRNAANIGGVEIL